MKVNTGRFLILFILFNLIKPETWFGEVYGYDTNDGKNGYAGSSGKPITAFYLNGNRRYRVHYKGDSKNTWTGEYDNSGVVGIGRSIDAIAISGGYYYRVRYKNEDWETPVSGYDIYDSTNGYAGTLGKEIDAIAIDGGNGYRVAYGGESSNVEEVSKRVTKNLFGVDHSYSYDKEETIINNKYVKVTVKLEYGYNFSQKSIINLVIKNHKIEDVNLGDFMNIFEELEKFTAFNINDLKTKIEYSYSNGMANGSVNVVYYFFLKKIQITAGSKITEDHHSFRGGFTITFHLKDDFNNNPGLVLAPCIAFLKRLGFDGRAATIYIRSILNDSIKIIETVIDNLTKYFPSLLSAFFGYFLFFILALATV